MKGCVEEYRSGTHTFSKTSRILKRSEFVRLSQKNRKIQNQHFVALFEKNAAGKTRLGITVTKRVGNAVARNQLKRYVREYYRRHSHTLRNGFDINIIVKKDASGIPSLEAYRSLRNIFCRIREKLDH